MNGFIRPAFLWHFFCQNHFGHPKRLKNHWGGCMWVKYQSFASSDVYFKRFGCPRPEWFWQKVCHKKGGQVEPFLS